jgi:peptidyl-prolyl cis-trans isomerase A (cyclophilin A)
VGGLAVVGIALGCGRPQPPGDVNPLLSPGSAEMRETAPERFQARFETSAGVFVVDVTRAWAPRGADRFYNLVRHGFYDGVRFFRVVPGFVVQFGISGDPAVAARWRDAVIPDDPVTQSNGRGTLTFATAGPGTRTTQLFISYGDNRRLDAMGFAPVGLVVEGMDVVDRIFPGYGEAPDQGLIESRGTAYLAERFPQLDSIARATIVTP